MFATRNTGVMSVASVKQGESLTMDDRMRNSEERLEGLSLSEDSTDKLSMCLEQGPLQTHGSLEDSECLSGVGGGGVVDPTKRYSHSRGSTERK